MVGVGRLKKKDEKAGEGEEVSKREGSFGGNTRDSTKDNEGKRISGQWESSSAHIVREKSKEEVWWREQQKHMGKTHHHKGYSFLGWGEGIACGGGKRGKNTTGGGVGRKEVQKNLENPARVKGERTCGSGGMGRRIEPVRKRGKQGLKALRCSA